MPTYEYRCAACGHTFERRQPITAEALTDCPSCAAPALRRLPGGGGGILVKGGGDRVSGCGFERTGTTCCGRRQRCDAPPCEGS